MYSYLLLREDYNESISICKKKFQRTFKRCAFAVCILSMLGPKVPVSLKVFLTALAIADDLIAILVVALFYGGQINFLLLGIAVLVILFTLLLRRLGEKHMFPYLFCAVVVWAQIGRAHV